MTKAGGKKLIAERVEEFEKNKAALTKRGHGETNIRTNYIDVLFESLGWNMKSHYDVVREFSQKDTSGTKKVDYAFKINGKLKFFVEAKEASVDLVNDKDAIYQAKRYAYSTNGRAPIVILTDFEEFRVFNVLKAPDYNNTDRELLKKYCFEYNQYLENWDLLWDTFSKEAVENGSLDAIRGKIDKNTKTMDVDFLEQITDWRETLAKNIALRNKELSVEELNEAVQRILDRLLFIRNLEDREIESENTLLDKTKAHEDIYKSIIPIFRNLDNVYNGLLFKKHFSEDLIVDDKALKDIIKNMCYPVSPFQFDVIEPEILGRIYEKFLGSKIRLTESHQAKVEEKMEVRKAGGVYYTPEYIVDYIVKNTVGKKIEGLTPEEIKKIKIVDPACGSGSFLLGAYSYILDYHARWYSENKKDKAYKNDYYINKDGELKVNLEKRGDILRNNIFGVDIDKEATEVAIMSLYLKMLDDGFDKGERDLFFIKGHVLPDMTNNVKCGNSLIGTDYFEGKLDFDIEEMKEIKPFDWNNEFADIFKNGGFDCVIGNPPYLAFQEGSTNIKKYFVDNYISSTGKYDQYVLFIEKSMILLSDYGVFGFIVPNKFIQSGYGSGIKKVILKYCIEEILDFGDIQIFNNATNYPCIIQISKKSGTILNYRKVISNNEEIIQSINVEINQKLLNNESWVLIDSKKLNLINKLQSKFNNLGNLAETITQGLRTGHLESFYSNINQKMIEQNYLEKDLIKPVFHGSNVKRYYNTLNKCDDLILFPYNEQGSPVNINDFPNAKTYLNKFRDKLNERKDSGKIFKNTNKQWFEFWDAKPICFKKNKIIFPDISSHNNFYLDEDGIGYLNTCYGIFLKNEVDNKVILGILNSKVVQFFIQQICPSVRGGYYRYKTNYISQIPIPIISENVTLSSLVDQMLQTQKDARNAKSEADKNLYEQKISMIDKKIDELVYKLYGLTEDEIKIVEG